MTGPTIGVIGAGIAGLTAADWLSAAGLHVEIHEARAQPGGRIHTIHASASPEPIELGAEFIHGRRNETWKILRGHPELRVFEFPDRHWEFCDGKLTENKNFWNDLDEIWGKLQGVQRDIPFNLYFRKFNREPRRVRELVEDYVEGFHAVELHKVGTKALEESEEAAENSEGQRQFRLAKGYGALVESLLERLRRRNVVLQFNQTIQRVRWRQGKVELFTNTRISQAYEAVLVTVPLGVLQATPNETGALAFDPDIAEKRKLFEKLEMGHATKMILVFRDIPWPEEVFGLIHAHNAIFPTWWTTKGSSVLVGWSGGPKADDLSGRPKDEIVGRALEELSLMFKIDRPRIQHLLAEAFVHDWQNDPFSRGAYSYLPAGTTDVPEDLRRPIEKNIVFCRRGIGTVRGAGYRPWRNCIRKISRTTDSQPRSDLIFRMRLPVQFVLSFGSVFVVHFIALNLVV